MQVVRAGPHVGEDQGPEVNHRQTIGVNRAASLLRNEVVHHAQEAGGQEEADGIVAIPPLNHGVLHTRVSRVGLGQGNRHSSAIDQVQQGNGDNEGTEEPVGHVDVGNRALGDGAEEDQRIRNPDQGDQDVDRPFQFGIFLTLGNTQRQGDSGEQNDDLPTPEGEGNQRTAPEAGVTGALNAPVRRCEQRAATKRKNNRVGVQRTQPAKMQEANIQLRPDQLGSNDDTDKHANNAPDDSHDGELPYDLIVVCGLRSRHEPTSR